MQGSDRTHSYFDSTLRLQNLIKIILICTKVLKYFRTTLKFKYFRKTLNFRIKHYPQDY